MRRARFAALAVAVGAPAACGYPDFAFRQGKQTAGSGGREPITTSSGSTGGTAGSGGAASSSASTSSSGGASSSSSSSGQGGQVVAQVPCTSAGTMCTAGEVCCYHIVDASQDHCAASGSCDPFFYYEFACNTSDDCAAGMTCCAIFDAQNNLLGVDCKATCSGNDVVMCKSSTDCSGGSCDPFPSSTNAYPGYKWCQ